MYVAKLQEHLSPYCLSEFTIHTLVVESQVLRDNPLVDPATRHNPVLVPLGKAPPGGWPVVLVLAGFTGNGPNYFAPKTFAHNLVQVLNECRRKGKAPRAVYVFPDTMTFWGGSQFVNSTATGRYEDYLMKELLPSIGRELPVSSHHKKWAIVGGSSGGYGALHLASRYPQRFHWVAASAPDSGFQWSLLPDLYQAAPYLSERTVQDLREDILSGQLLERPDSHAILNAIAMAACYSPKQKGRERAAFEFPLDLVSGELKPATWKRWQSHDPVHFLAKRKAAVRSWGGVYLDVGKLDQYYLYYGTRKIAQQLKVLKVAHHYEEFNGNHFDLHTRRPMIWNWLAKKLRA